MSILNVVSGPEIITQGTSCLTMLINPLRLNQGVKPRLRHQSLSVDDS